MISDLKKVLLITPEITPPSHYYAWALINTTLHEPHHLSLTSTVHSSLAPAACSSVRNL